MRFETKTCARRVLEKMLESNVQTRISSDVIHHIYVVYLINRFLITSVMKNKFSVA